MNLYNFIKSLDAKTLALYIGIILIFLWFFSRWYIGLNIILGVILAIVVIIYFYQKNENIEKLDTELDETKLDRIKPSPDNFYDSKSLVDFFFSIQDFYQYNPQAYEETVDNVNSFMELRNYIFREVRPMDNFCNYYYQIAESKRDNALNSLASIIYKLPNNPLFSDKLNKATGVLNILLNKYLAEIYEKCASNQKQFGLNIYKTPLSVGPKAYSPADSSFQFY